MNWNTAIFEVGTAVFMKIQVFRNVTLFRRVTVVTKDRSAFVFEAIQREVPWVLNLQLVRVWRSLTAFVFEIGPVISELKTRRSTAVVESWNCPQHVPMLHDPSEGHDLVLWSSLLTYKFSLYESVNNSLVTNKFSLYESVNNSLLTHISVCMNLSIILY